MVGPSQAPVSLIVNIPKTQDNQNNNAKASKNPYVKLFNPRYNLVKKKQTSSKQVILKNPYRHSKVRD